MPRKKAPWKPAFLENLRRYCNVSLACRTAAISRSAVYKAAQHDLDFAEAWDDAIDDGVDLLELEARRRAVQGVERTKFLRTGTDDEGRPIYERVVRARVLRHSLDLLAQGPSA